MKTSQYVYSDTDLLTWVGEGAYKTIDHFITEAQQQGCSRRLPGRLDWVKPGDTRVYLAHKNDQVNKAFGVLFGFYTINSIHVIYDDLECERDIKYKTCRPVLRPGAKPPQDIEEFTEYVVRRKIVIVRRGERENDLLDELWKEWLKKALKRTITRDGNRYIPLSDEAHNLERLCGGASSLGSGRFPGAYASDELGDWLLDKILDWLLEDPEWPSEEYFWEEIVEEEVVVRRRKKQKRVRPGLSRSGQMSLEKIYDLYGEPPGDLSRLVVFEKPYPLYFHPPKAAFRGFQRIDGNSLLLKVNLPQYLKK